MADIVLVERVDRDVVARALEREFLRRREVMQIALSPADRAIAFQRPGRRLFVECVGDLAAMAASPDSHRTFSFSMRCPFILRSEEHTSELQSLMRISYAVFCLKNKTSDTAY